MVSVFPFGAGHSPTDFSTEKHNALKKAKIWGKEKKKTLFKTDGTTSLKRSVTDVAFRSGSNSLLLWHGSHCYELSFSQEKAQQLLIFFSFYIRANNCIGYPDLINTTTNHPQYLGIDQHIQQAVCALSRRTTHDSTLSPFTDTIITTCIGFPLCKTFNKCNMFLWPSQNSLLRFYPVMDNNIYR